MVLPNPRTRLYHPQAGEPYVFCTDAENLGIKRTLRFSSGEFVACFNGDGNEYIYQIGSLKKESIELSLWDSFPNPRDDQNAMAVFVAAIKGKTRDRILKDLPPLGVTDIHFYPSERSIAKLEEEQADRMKKIVLEACRQCGRSTIPNVGISSLPLLDRIKQSFDPNHTLVFWEKERAGPLEHWQKKDPPSVLVFGPEGGFSPQEEKAIQQKQLITSSLGKRILRTELAVNVGCTLVGIAWPLASSK